MARRSFRDRFLTPQVARAITSPGGILLAGLGVSVGVVACLPVVAAAGIGAAAWAVRVAVAVPRDAPAPRIDAGRLREPWRSFVKEAQEAQQQFTRARQRAGQGPLHDRLAEIDERIVAGVQECWRGAPAGHDHAIAPHEIDVADITRQRQDVDPRAAAVPGSAAAGTLEALDAQLAATARMDRVITEVSDRLRLLDARLDEAVTRAIELSVRADNPDELSGLGDDIDVLVGDMESLRQGLDEVDASSTGRGGVPSLPASLDPGVVAPTAGPQDGLPAPQAEPPAPEAGAPTPQADPGSGPPAARPPIPPPPPPRRTP
ncbi:MAG: hypothetical protein ACXWCB_05390 [Acidimicrobiales bacterium]